MVAKKRAQFPMPPLNSRQSGFTLIELSIVLVIIALLVGGVIVGREMVSSAQMRSQISQFEKYNQAANTFRIKYDCLPGDCARATTFLENLASYGCGGACGNGDGNGIIKDSSGHEYDEKITMEPLQFWAHLFLSGIVDCCASRDWLQYTIGNHSPRDKINGFGISVLNLNGNNGYFWGITANTRWGVTNTGWGWDSWPELTYPLGSNAGVLTPLEANSFDSKIDDGLPTVGRVITARLNGSGIFVSVSQVGYNCLASSSAYNIAYTDKACSLFIRM